MTDDIRSLFDQAAPAIDPSHQDAVWARVAAKATGGNGAEAERPRNSAPQARAGSPTKPVIAAGPLTMELDPIPANVTRLRPRRTPVYAGLAAASLVAIAGVGFTLSRRPGTVTVSASVSTAVSTTPTTSTPRASTTATVPVTATTVPPTTIAPTTAAPTTSIAAPTTLVATTTTAPAPTSTVPTTTKATIASGRPTAFDALTVGSPKSGTVVATFDGALVDDVWTGLSVTPEGQVFYVGFNRTSDAFFVQFFAEGGAPRHFELPASYFSKTSGGQSKYAYWTLGAAQVLYGQEFDDSVNPVAIVAVATSGPKSGLVIARTPLAPRDLSGRCILQAGGVACTHAGDTSESPTFDDVLGWVDPSGAPMAKSFDAFRFRWVGDDRARVLHWESAKDSPTVVDLPRGGQVSLSNLRAWNGLTQRDYELNAARIEVMAERPTETCLYTTVGWENPTPGFALCVTRDGKTRATMLPLGMASYIGATLHTWTSSAFYTVEPAGHQFNLVRYDY